VFKLRTKFEQNRTNRGCVIDNLAKFEWDRLAEFTLQSLGPNCTKFGENRAPHRCIRCDTLVPVPRYFGTGTACFVSKWRCLEYECVKNRG